METKGKGIQMSVTFKVAIITAILSALGLSPVWCDSCGEMQLDGNLETHVFEEWHEYDNEGGTSYEIVAYTMDVCPTCVDYWTGE